MRDAKSKPTTITVLSYCSVKRERTPWRWRTSKAIALAAKVLLIYVMAVAAVVAVALWW
jgi:hypothetical protein